MNINHFYLEMHTGLTIKPALISEAIGYDIKKVTSRSEVDLDYLCISSFPSFIPHNEKTLRPNSTSVFCIKFVNTYKSKPLMVIFCHKRQCVDHFLSKVSQSAKLIEYWKSNCNLFVI